jgi:YopX protein
VASFDPSSSTSGGRWSDEKPMFRIWNRRTKQWQERDFHLIGEVMLLQGFPIKELNDLVVNEATGLKDKNGKEIYEGDRLKNGATYRLVRLVESQAAWFAGSRRLTRELAARCEVTGNDYEGATSRSRSNLRRLVMPIDLQQLNEIHRLEGEEMKPAPA